MLSFANARKIFEDKKLLKNDKKIKCENFITY